MSINLLIYGIYTKLLYIIYLYKETRGLIYLLESALAFPICLATSSLSFCLSSSS